VGSGGTRPAAVVEAVPGVPAPAVTPHLDQPRPDLIGRRVDGDGHRRRPLAVGDELGTGIRAGDLRIGCAPTHEPRTHPGCVDDSRRASHASDAASNRHRTTVGASAGPRKGPTSRPAAWSAFQAALRQKADSELAIRWPGSQPECPVLWLPEGALAFCKKSYDRPLMAPYQG
jgi:hypothetical protein